MARAREELPEIRIRAGLNPNNLQNRPTYGPVFATSEDPSFEEIKKDTWNHATYGKPGAEIGITSAVRLIEREARNGYADLMLANFQGDVFVYRMAKDAVFFLQLVLFWFGADLGYPPEHLFFGSNRDENYLRWCLESMFIVGNQIPLVVFEKLMRQNFFEQAMERMTDWKKPVGLLETVFYEFVLVPASRNNKHGPTLSTSLQKPVPKPIDLLHGLYLIVLGSGNDPNEENGRQIQIMMRSAVDNADNAMRFPRAKEIKKAGIHFKGIDGMGSRGISFERRRFKRILRLPHLVVDDSTELLFENLEAYEMVQQFSNREVASLLRFMSQLVLTIEDAKILESEGVVKGHVTKLPTVPACILSSTDVYLSRKLYNIKLQINECSRPRFQKLKTGIKYSFSAAVLVGIVFTVLQYFKKDNS